MYEPVTRIPLLFWSPSLFSDGRRIREKCQLFDLAPTILDLAGDPLEQRNLWGVGEHAGEISRLKDAFINWRQNSLLETMDLNAAAR